MRPLLLTAIVAAVACGGRGEPAVPRTADRDLAGNIAELKYRIASNPRDLRAHLGLARLQQEAGLPGAAIRQYELVARNRTLAPADRRSFAGLLAARAVERLALGDAEAGTDLARARELDPTLEVSAEIEVELAALALLAALRERSDVAARAAAAELRALAPADPRLAAVDPDSRGDALAEAAAWAWDGGARRRGLALLERYVETGGRAPALLARFARARVWWQGPEALSLLDRDLLAAAGVRLCRLSRTPRDAGCRLARELRDPTAARALLEHAELLGWRATHPDHAAGWTVAALRGWLAGDGDWDQLLRRRIDLARITPGDAPAFARATLARLAGDGATARDAFDRALAAAAALEPIERAVLIAEASRQGRETAVIDRLLALGADTDGWRAALRDAALRDDPERARLLVDAAPPEARSREGLGRGVDGDRRRARYRALVDSIVERRVAPGSFGRPNVADPELRAIADAYFEDPAVADRLADELVDRRHAVATRGRDVARLFRRLGDPARADQWWRAMLRASPRFAAVELGAALAAVAAGDPTRAVVHAERAAAGSGDGGAVYLAVARAMVDARQPAEALLMTRSAVQLSAGARQLRALEVAIAALELLGRDEELVAIRAELAARRGAPDAAPDPIDPVVAAQTAGAAERAVAIAIALAAWNPRRAAPRRAILELVPADDPRANRALRGLIEIAVDDRAPAAQREALAALAEALQRAGRPALAAAARRQRATIVADPISPLRGASGR